MIKSFKDFNYLGEDDTFLCICNLVDAGFTYDYQITDNSSDYGGEIGLYRKDSNFDGSVANYHVIYCNSGSYDIDNHKYSTLLSKEQNSVYIMALDCVYKLGKISGITYDADIDFAKDLTAITFSRRK